MLVPRGMLTFDWLVLTVELTHLDKDKENIFIAFSKDTLSVMKFVKFADGLILDFK